MKNKGFTLIELLAVIVILAIIALIATPIILGIINDAREQAKKRSAELVYTGIEYAYTEALYSGADGATVTTPTLADIKSKLNIENVKESNVKLDPETKPTKIVITTDDSVVCVVTTDETTKSLKIQCGKSESDASYLTSKTLEGTEIKAETE